MNSFSNISQNPFDYKNNPDFTYTQNGPFIRVENDQLRLSFGASVSTEFFDRETGKKLDFKEFNILDMAANGNLEPFYKKMEEAREENTYSGWNLDVLTIKKKTGLSGLGEYIGWSPEEVLKEFPNVQIVKKNYLCYANEPEYCFISFYFKRGKVSTITFVDDYY
ncbi:MAG: hypothetical protein LBG22_13220 [Treponema sp.]|nr:hypothetical protein [Treponema sp.]